MNERCFFCRLNVLILNNKTKLIKQIFILKPINYIFLLKPAGFIFAIYINVAKLLLSVINIVTLKLNQKIERFSKLPFRLC